MDRTCMHLSPWRNSSGEMPLVPYLAGCKRQPFSPLRDEYCIHPLPMNGLMAPAIAWTKFVWKTVDLYGMHRQAL